MSFKYPVGKFVCGKTVLEHHKEEPRRGHNVYRVRSECCGRETLILEYSLERLEREFPGQKRICRYCSRDVNKKLPNGFTRGEAKKTIDVSLYHWPVPPSLRGLRHE